MRTFALALLLAGTPHAAPAALAPPPARRTPQRRAAAWVMAGGTFGAESFTVVPGSKAFIVGAMIKSARYKTLEAAWELDDSLDELERLCETAGLVVVGRESQTLQTPSPSTFIGPGKVQEVVAAVREVEATAVVFDEELSPAQGRNLQQALAEGAGADVLVVDRTQLILQIFAQRARSREAKLAVQAAQMRYMLPRLQSFLTAGAGMDAKGGTSGGGGALKGSGETQLETDKRLFRKQIQRIEAEIDEAEAQRSRFRARREARDRLPLIAIVGYTNSGKSTLLNRLCGATEVYADDLLFATLDPTTRRLRLPDGGREVLVSDTVGFIQKLPTRLVSAFRATLEEVKDASVLVHVVDASSRQAQHQAWSVMNIIADLGAGDKPHILVLNKADVAGIRAGDADGELGLIPAGAPVAERWLSLHPSVQPSSVVVTAAKTGAGIDDLLADVERTLRLLSVEVECVVPYAEGQLLAEVHRDGTIDVEEFREDGTYLVAHVPRSLGNRLAPFRAAAG